MAPELTLEGLHHFLTEHDWAPPIDLIRKLAAKRPWLTHFYTEYEPYAPPGQFSVFIVRGIAHEHGWHGRVREYLDRRGFCILHEETLSEEKQLRAKTKIRGGNWEEHLESQISRNGPKALIAVYDPRPVTPPRHLRKSMPFLTNFEVYNAKSALRELMQDDIGHEDCANSLHASDDELEAWEYIDAIAPGEKTRIQNEILAMQPETRTANSRP